MVTVGAEVVRAGGVESTTVRSAGISGLHAARTNTNMQAATVSLQFPLQ
jgi:hypothetical protein